MYDNTDLVRCHIITNNNLNYSIEDKIEILKVIYYMDLKIVLAMKLII